MHSTLEKKLSIRKNDINVKILRTLTDFKICLIIINVFFKSFFDHTIEMTKK